MMAYVELALFEQDYCFETFYVETGTVFKWIVNRTVKLDYWKVLIDKNNILVNKTDHTLVMGDSITFTIPHLSQLRLSPI